ncbi:hypothetical protein LTR53_001922 [Teratosphaeriaceae sp. CCFEE 6253]|nr:hypothetical protein LTR53_001922 [Teratosphaeriaceae sp. CCFEE 6253]
MAGNRAFRLLDLPPELRTRCYECFFEDHEPRAITLFEAQRYAPCLAVTATSRQVRDETLKLGEDAIARYYQQQHFQIDLRLSYWGHPGHYQHELPRALRSVLTLAATTPCLPVSACRLRVKGQRNDTHSILMRLSDSGAFECTEVWPVDTVENELRTQVCTRDFLEVAKRLGVTVNQHEDPRFLHIGNILRVFLSICGWHLPPIAALPARSRGS